MNGDHLNYGSSVYAISTLNQLGFAVNVSGYTGGNYRVNYVAFGN
jgi:hypothetical protein